MKRLAALLMCALAALVCSCQRTPDEVVDKVLMDWGIRERPEGYLSGSDRVFEKLSEVAKTEMKRLNQEGRHGTVKFQEEKGLRGKYYKEVKVYEDFYPLDAQPSSRATDNERGYVAYIEYSYRIHESERKTARAEAAAESANIATTQDGRETYRYRFSSGGTWSGAKGERVRR